MPPPPGFDEIQREELSRLYRRMTGIRLIAIPVAVALLAFVAVFEPARWRTAFLLAVLLPIGTFFVTEAVRARRRGFDPAALPINLLSIWLAQSALVAATGALESPFLVVFVPLALVAGLFASRRAHRVIVALQLAVVWLLAALELRGVVPDLEPALFGGGPRAGHRDAHLVATAVVLTVVLAAAARAGRGIRRAFDGMLVQALRAREESLRLHADRAQELTALSAEIAHELKNPLASVKGLAALLAEPAPPEKQAERLAVLRREVHRMQGVLDEFLNFSRPLVPLALARVDLAAIAREVAALHEGLAHERGVRIALAGGAAAARADPRKVKQVLINLVQNAVEASPPGGTVELEVEAAADEARVRVLDRGPGVAPAVGGRAFDPGVTSKPRGSGLGLTIARALARQHGGEVELAARDGGGCAAVLRLPGEAAAPAAAAEAAR